MNEKSALCIIEITVAASGFYQSKDERCICRFSGRADM
jgi:hypothetical protein